MVSETSPVSILTALVRDGILKQQVLEHITSASSLLSSAGRIR